MLSSSSFTLSEIGKFHSNHCIKVCPVYHRRRPLTLSYQWFLAGQLRSFTVQRQVQSYLGRQNQPGDPDTTISDALGLTGRQPASPSTIEALPKEKIYAGRTGDDMCPICLAPLEATQLPCGHWYHFVCVETWCSKHDACPNGRSSIVSTSI